MGDTGYTVRNYQPSDFHKFVLLNIEAEQLEPTGRSVSPRVIAEGLGRPNYSPERDLLVVEMASKIVGYMNVTRELGIGRVVLDCWVHPEHRKRGLAAQLLNRAMERAREAGARVAHVNVAEGDTRARRVLSSSGFQLVRRFLELTIDLTRVKEQGIEEALVGYRQMQSGEEKELTRIQNRAFAGSWGYNPNTVAEIVYRTNLSHRSPEDVIIIGEEEKMVGYCWLGVVDAGEAAVGAKRGRIFMLGADPDYRGRGAGKKALLAGLSFLKKKGLRFAGLTVDSENKVACALYRSVGFKVRGNSLWYEKTVV